MSGIVDILLWPMNAMFAATRTYPWPVIIGCTVAAVALYFAGHGGYSALLVCYFSCVMIWVDEVKNPRRINEGTAAGD